MKKGAAMIIATEKIIPGVLPPKEPTPDVDFLSILHSFDPSTCTDEALEVFAERNPSIIPPYEDELGRQMPDAQRCELAQVIAGADERDLAVAIRQGDYSKCRKALVKAIGTKVCLYILESGMLVY